MSEQDNSPETNTDSPKSPSTPEKRFSISKIIENIILFASGIIFITSLFSKDKNFKKESIKTNTQKSKQDTLLQNKKEDKKSPHPCTYISKIMISLRGLIASLFETINKKKTLEMSKKLSMRIVFAAFMAILVFLASLFFTTHWGEATNATTSVLEFLFPNDNPVKISLSLAATTFLLFLFTKIIVAKLQKYISNLTSKYFIFTLAVLALLGGAAALIIPSYTNLFRESGYTSPLQDSTKENPEKAQNNPTPTASPTGNKAAEVEQKSTSDLRLHLLYITGGIIAILGLIETNRKNSQDHIRQIHADRRDRYIEAVDKLSSDNAPVRLGGVYALVGLVDEWLDDDNINEEIRLKEGQVIVNNLCSYIRSPFAHIDPVEEYEARQELKKLENKESSRRSVEEQQKFKLLHHRFNASAKYKKPRNITDLQAKVLEEQSIRRTIFVEMSKRSSTLSRGKKNTNPGPWSNFDFDFSQAQIFYPLSDITIEKANFIASKFYGKADFRNTIFPQDQNFSRAIFNETPIINEIRFAKIVNLSGAVFREEMRLTDMNFRQKINFSGAIFEKDLLIWGTEFHQDALFKETIFKGSCYFNRTNFKGAAKFTRAKFKGVANFTHAVFEGPTDFSEVIFYYARSRRFAEIRKTLPSAKFPAKFYGATFNKDTYFIKTRFEEGVEFIKAIFKKSVDFTDAYFAEEVLFSQGSEKNGAAKFSVNVASDAYEFKHDSFSHKIVLGKATLYGNTFEIPLDTVLFNPDSDDISDPAK